jgi:hypothetical protein
VRPYLPGEHLFTTEVIGDRSQARGLSVQRERGERQAVVVVAADELGREVLGLRRTAAVADCEEASAAEEDARQLSAPTLEAEELAFQRDERRRQGGEVDAEAVSGVHLTASFRSTGASATSSR